MAETASVVIPAAGQGKRLERTSPKAAVRVHGKPLITRTVRPFLSLDLIGEIVIVEPPEASLRDVVREEGLDTGRIHYVKGGSSRYASVRNGVQSLQDPGKYLLIHDAARPFVTEPLIQRVVNGVEEDGAAIPVLSIPDTVKRVRDGRVLETVDRDELVRAQTPQGFLPAVYERAMNELTVEEGNALTDDAAVVQKTGQTVRVVDGEWRNFKITYPEDLTRAERLLKEDDKGGNPMNGGRC